MLGQAPDYTVASDWSTMASSNAARVPVVTARPGSPASADLRAVADQIRAIAVSPPVGSAQLQGAHRH